MKLIFECYRATSFSSDLIGIDWCFFSLSVSVLASASLSYRTDPMLTLAHLKPQKNFASTMIFQSPYQIILFASMN